MFFLNIVKVAAVIAGIIAIPLLYIGAGFFISFPLFIFAFVLHKEVNTKKLNLNNSQPSLLFLVITIAAGLACFYGLYLLGALGNIDTSGKPSNLYMVISGSIVTLVTTVIIVVTSKTKKKIF